MTAPSPTPWFLRKAAVLVALALFGPLALLLVWKSPEFTRRVKIVLVAVTLVMATIFMAVTPLIVSTLEAQLAGAF